MIVNRYAHDVVAEGESKERFLRKSHHGGASVRGSIGSRKVSTVSQFQINPKFYRNRAESVTSDVGYSDNKEHRENVKLASLIPNKNDKKMKEPLLKK